MTRAIFVCGFLLFLAAGLAACAEGSASERFVDPALAESYLNLRRTERPDWVAGGAAIVIAPNIAVTNAHNANLLAEEDILARSIDYDLLFFRTPLTQAVRTAEPEPGQEVVAYGHGGGETRREARGLIEMLMPSPENCADCAPGTGFSYRAPGGPGFSGGPVAHAETGAVLGLTFAYIDSPIDSGEPRRMLAYTVAQIRAEMTRLLPR